MLKDGVGIGDTAHNQLPTTGLDTPTESPLNLSTSILVDSQHVLDVAETLGRIAKSRADAGVLSREMGITFRDLQVVGLGAASSFQDTVGSIFNPFNMIRQVQAQRHPATRHIISGFEGTVTPGEMLLVLGRPGSGCSTLLKVLSNKRDEFHAIGGDVRYNNLPPQVIEKHYRGDVYYCPEDDIHFSTLTVGQTIEFAARVRAPRERLGKTRLQYAEETTDLLLSLFGLQHARNTLVGDATIRGISGGEKKRLSICEAMAARACLTSWDTATRGLDSSTALEFIQILRAATDVNRLTSIVSLYQAGERLYELFDKVCVIYEGRMAYFGPANEARDYFINLGYGPAHRQTTADFLVSVTDPNARIPRQVDHPAPRTAAEFASWFSQSQIGRQNSQSVDNFGAELRANKKSSENYIQSAREEHDTLARLSSPYVSSLPAQATAVMLRRIQILRGAFIISIINIVGYIFQGIVLGTTYLKEPQSTSAFFSRSGILFFSLFFFALMAMPEIPALFAQRPIILRHQQSGFYHPFIDAVALTLVDVPVTLLNSLVFGGILYGLVGLEKSAGQLFIYFLFVFTTAVVMRAYFRSLAAMCAFEPTAQMFAGLSVLAMCLYAGYIIPETSMIWALRWMTFVNPFKYGFESLMANEFRDLNGECSNIIPHGPTYTNISIENKVCAVVGAISGETSVQGARFIKLSLGYTYSHLWRNLGIVIAFGVAFLAVLFLFTEINTKFTGISAMVLYKQGSEVPDQVDRDDTEGVEMMIIENKHPDKTNGKTKFAREEDTKGHTKDPIKASSHGTFSFTGVNYTISADGKDRRLLEDITGYISPGSLTALMGESGAGKTTLLNVLANRVDVGVVSGDRFIDGKVLPEDFQSQTGYCQQIDTHLPTSTVREALLFSAKLRQSSSISLREKEEYVDQCLHMCGLWNYRNAIVGTLGVELRKRTTVGVELAAKPKFLLFLDEPTSGLDSQSAWSVITFLRSLADQGQAILCTIHQPSAELFHVFDKLLLLKKGGQTVYFGDLGHNATTLLEYFEKNDARPCEPIENPAEYMLDVIGAGATASSNIDWFNVWQKSSEKQALDQEIQRIHSNGSNGATDTTTLVSEYVTSWSNQFFELIKRGASDHYRNVEYLMAKLSLNIIAGMFLGFTFYKKQSSIQGTQNRLFALHMALIISIPLSNQLQVPYIATRQVYEIRERPSRMYSWTALLTSQIIVEICWNILGSSLFFFAWYWTSHFPTHGAGYGYLAMGVVFPIYYTTIAQSIASMAPNAEIAQLLFGFLFSFVLTFNGVIQPYSHLGWWKWMYRLSPYKYLLEGLAGQGVGHRQIVCSPIEFVTLNPPDNQTCAQYLSDFIASTGGYLQNPGALVNCSFCPLRTTDELLGPTFNIFYHNRWQNIGIMIAFIGFNIFTIFLFTYLFRIHKGSLLPSSRKRN